MSSTRGGDLIKNFLLAAGTVILLLCAFELLLRTGFLDAPESPSPVWISARLKARHEAVELQNRRRSLQNWYKFNNELDIIDTLDQRGVKVRRKPPGVKRIVALGDSFVWGEGLSYENSWPMMLQAQLDSSRPGQAEVIGWGKPGWETLEQFKFLSDFTGMMRDMNFPHEIDLVIAGFVVNDPNMGRFPPKVTSVTETTAFKFSRTLLRDTSDFFASYIDNLLDRYYYNQLGYGFKAWEDRLFSDENLRQYTALLRDLKRFCEIEGIEFFFVLTPPNAEEYFKKRHESVKPYFDKAGVRYLDLYPHVKETLGSVNPRLLWANPADGHPGSRVTEVYAREITAYLETAGFFDTPSDSSSVLPAVNDASELRKIKSRLDTMTASRKLVYK